MQRLIKVSVIIIRLTTANIGTLLSGLLKSVTCHGAHREVITAQLLKINLSKTDAVDKQHFLQKPQISITVLPSVYLSARKTRDDSSCEAEA